MRRLFSAKPELSIAFFLLLVGPVRYVFDEDLGVAPSVRQNGIGRGRLAAEICQDEPPQRVKVEKPHSVCSFGLSWERRDANEFNDVESREA